MLLLMVSRFKGDDFLIGSTNCEDCDFRAVVCHCQEVYSPDSRKFDDEHQETEHDILMLFRIYAVLVYELLWFLKNILMASLLSCTRR